MAVEGYADWFAFWQDCKAAMMVKLTGAPQLIGYEGREFPPDVHRLVDAAVLREPPPGSTHAELLKAHRAIYTRLRKLAQEEWDGSAEPTGGDTGAAYPGERRFADP
jgi:hypothetical protein